MRNSMLVAPELRTRPAGRAPPRSSMGRADPLDATSPPLLRCPVRMPSRFAPEASEERQQRTRAVGSRSLMNPCTRVCRGMVAAGEHAPETPGRGRGERVVGECDGSSPGGWRVTPDRRHFVGRARLGAARRGTRAPWPLSSAAACRVPSSGGRTAPGDHRGGLRDRRARRGDGVPRCTRHPGGRPAVGGRPARRPPRGRGRYPWMVSARAATLDRTLLPGSCLLRGARRAALSPPGRTHHRAPEEQPANAARPPGAGGPRGRVTGHERSDPPYLVTPPAATTQPASGLMGGGAEAVRRPRRQGDRPHRAQGFVP